MGSVQQKSSGRVLAVLISAVTLSVLAVACVAPSGGGGGVPGPTTTSTTTTTSSTIPFSPPTGQWFGLNMTCYFSVFGSFYNFAQSAFVNVEAPATVNAGDTFDITVTPGTFNVPTVVQGYTVSSVDSFTIRFPLSPNVQFVDSLMSSGINMGSGYPSLTVEEGFLVYRVPGPLAAGSTVQMPKDRLTFIASGAPGSTIETRMQTLSNVARFPQGSVGNTCYPDVPNMLFTTTAIL